MEVVTQNDRQKHEQQHDETEKHLVTYLVTPLLLPLRSLLLRPRTLLIASALLLSSCLSVNIGGGKMKKSEGVKISAPPAPFQDAKNQNADRAWINKKNGNTISYLSVCNDPADPSIEAASQDLFNDLTGSQIVKTEHFSFNHRDALRTEVKGEIDGVPTQITAVIFKRNDCMYTISYVGVVKAYADDHARFESFLTSFEAP